VLKREFLVFDYRETPIYSNRNDNVVRVVLNTVQTLFELLNPRVSEGGSLEKNKIFFRNFQFVEKRMKYLVLIY